MKKFFVFCYSYLISACGVLDAPERNLVAKEYAGEIVFTRLNDKELEEVYGMQILYRFLSMPNIVAVAGYRPSPGIELLWQSREIQKLIERNGKNSPPEKQMVSLSEEGLLNLVESAQNKQKSEVGHDKAASLDEMSWFAPTQEIGLRRYCTALNTHCKDLAPVGVAIIDSGVYPASQPIAKAIVKQTNFTDQAEALQWQSHATAIASIFAGVELKNTVQNAYAPNALLHSIKISFANDPNGPSTPLAALQLALAIDAAVANGDRVVNLSFTYQGNVPENVRLLELALLANGSERGTLFVAAAGNQGKNLEQSCVLPACYDVSGMVVVGNHRSDLVRASSSNFGNLVDVTAQGNYLPLTDKNGEVQFFSGTSFSAPIVAAVLALIMGSNPALSHHEARQMLFQAAEPSYFASPERVSRFGRIRLNPRDTAINSLEQLARLPKRLSGQSVPNQ